MNIEPRDFLMAVLRGDLYSSTPLPLELCNRLAEQEKEAFVLDRPSGAAQFCDIYSPEGWANELARREYMVKLSLPPPTPKKTKQELQKELAAAIDSGNEALALSLFKEIKAL